MGTRRSILKAGLGVCTCTACGAALLDHIATTARADATTRVQGPGYDLRFIGAQRETVMNGTLAAALECVRSRRHRIFTESVRSKSCVAK
jgi:hypothetical protein